jgi:protein-S-isoprenylcysteine O-methyltransferase Ste14
MKSMLVANTAAARVGESPAIGLEIDIAPQASAAEAKPRARRDYADSLARVGIVCLFSFMAVRIGANFLESGRLTGLLLLASEALVVALTVCRRAPVIVDRSLRARLLTTFAMMGPPLVSPVAKATMVQDGITVAIGAVGLLVVIAGKISLGRSFGFIPANRGIVSTGLYRLVRHPIYMGYLLTHVAFLAANPTLWNIGLLVASDIALLARAVCEEQTLAKDEQYRAYQTRVRWRVVPGVF